MHRMSHLYLTLSSNRSLRRNGSGRVRKLSQYARPRGATYSSPAGRGGWPYERTAEVVEHGSE